MFKKLTDKITVFNPEIEADAVLTVFTSGMPKWQWRIVKDAGDTFEITGKRRWHRLGVSRHSKGRISVSYDDSILWALCTFGLTYALAEITKARHRSAALKLLKERIPDLEK